MRQEDLNNFYYYVDNETIKATRLAGELQPILQGHSSWYTRKKIKQQFGRKEARKFKKYMDRALKEIIKDKEVK
jgi:hypothetical protein